MRLLSLPERPCGAWQNIRKKWKTTETTETSGMVRTKTTTDCTWRTAKPAAHLAAGKWFYQEDLYKTNQSCEIKIPPFTCDYSLCQCVHAELGKNIRKKWKTTETSETSDMVWTKTTTDCTRWTTKPVAFLTASKCFVIKKICIKLINHVKKKNPPFTCDYSLCRCVREDLGKK